MKKKGYVQEIDRLNALREYNILDTPSEQIYDDITALAAYICDVPIALISLIDADRQWFKSKVGLNVRETPRDISFCAHAILNPDIMVVNDALEDERFAQNPLVTSDPGIRFYAGVPLTTPNGYQLGTLCVIDYRPRDLSNTQKKTLAALARQVVMQMELQRVSAQLAEALDQIELMAGLVPICSYCKGIRNDQGYWSTVESFMEQHANVEFTHGVCDRCMRQHFPEVANILLAQDDPLGYQTDPSSQEPT
ncbi:GAF domain-containing protein [Nodosilinea sp. P-1105]|uniref:GAF domain-containing protein n=1 Tax=Nodosilinea sp. P-1105 TaxID=2546229 RepID=UPI00146DCE71|nr:GAF domain-containing protein [Nodosilinea sp. P-1105]NMF82794.1 GAF domain-containing protein [Nodosilinea sp. P-1105]